MSRQSTENTEDSTVWRRGLGSKESADDSAGGMRRNDGEFGSFRGGRGGGDRTDTQDRDTGSSWRSGNVKTPGDRETGKSGSSKGYGKP